VLLYLGEAIQGDLEEKSKNFNSAITAVEYLSIAHMEGKHLVTGSRDTLIKIISLGQYLSEKIISLYKKLLYEVPQYGAVGSRLSVYAIIIGFDENETKSLSGEQTTLHIPLRFFNDSSKIQPVNFIAENSDDTKLVRHLCRAYAFEKRLHNLKFNFNPVMGGGDQTAKEYKSSQDKGLFTICVVDSDKNYPDGNIGETARKVKFVNNTSIYSDYRILDCRELENLIPEKQLYLACSDDQTRMRAVNFIKYLEQTTNSEKRLYIDFKNGLKLLDIYSLLPNSPLRNYWGDARKLISDESHVDNECLLSNKCNEKSTCLTEGNKRDCRSIVMHSLGNKICESVVNILDLTSPQKLYESLCTLTKRLWDIIGSFVFSWSCCGIRLII